MNIMSRIRQRSLIRLCFLLPVWVFCVTPKISVAFIALFVFILCGLIRLAYFNVDEDEEALNLVKFQYSYNMASKIISVMNQMLDKLINDTGMKAQKKSRQKEKAIPERGFKKRSLNLAEA